jgi:hypothetical protein
MEEIHELTQLRLIREQETRRPTRVSLGLRGVTTLSIDPGKRPTTVRRALSKPNSFGIEPALEFRRARDEETVQQIAPIKKERIFRSTGVESCLEFGDVRPDSAGRDSDFIISARQDGILPQRTPQYMQRLAQGISRVRYVEFGPEKREQLIAAMKAVRTRYRKKCE